MIVVDVLVAILPSILYFEQIYYIIKSKENIGYSIDTSGILLFANSTRIIFWFGEHYQINLLIQSILLILTHLLLLYVCIRYSPPAYQSRYLDFWQWNKYYVYVLSLISYNCLLIGLYFILHRYHIFVNILGYLALGLEATLPIPQIIKNYQQKSLEGFKYTILLGWIAGDSFKVVYFILQSSPLPFALCSIIQVTFDISKFYLDLITKNI